MLMVGKCIYREWIMNDPCILPAVGNSQTDMYGDLLSEEVGQEKSYDETKM